MYTRLFVKAPSCTRYFEQESRVPKMPDKETGTLSTCMIIRYKHTFNNMFDNKVATKIARIWNPLQLCGNPFRAFRLNFIMVNCKNCMACSCNQTVYHPINYSSSDIFNILSRQVL